MRKFLLSNASHAIIGVALNCAWEVYVPLINMFPFKVNGRLSTMPKA